MGIEKNAPSGDDDVLAELGANDGEAADWRNHVQTIKTRDAYRKRQVAMLKEIGRAGLQSTDPKIQQLAGRLLEVQALILLLGGKP